MRQYFLVVQVLKQKIIECMNYMFWKIMKEHGDPLQFIKAEHTY